MSRADRYRLSHDLGMLRHVLWRLGPTKSCGAAVCRLSFQMKENLKTGSDPENIQRRFGVYAAPNRFFLKTCTTARALMDFFFLLFVRNWRRITSGPTPKPWRLSATALYLSRSLLKSRDTLKYRSSVSAIRKHSLWPPFNICPFGLKLITAAGCIEVLELCDGVLTADGTHERWVSEIYRPANDSPAIISSHRRL